MVWHIPLPHPIVVRTTQVLSVFDVAPIIGIYHASMTYLVLGVNEPDLVRGVRALDVATVYHEDQESFRY